MKRLMMEKRFDRLKLIHRGQWAVSYQAFDSIRRIPVFLKILNPVFHQDTEILSRFRRELEIAGKIKHPHVVKLVDSGEMGGSQFIAFEWLEGKPLDTFISAAASPQGEERVEPLSVRIVYEYAKQIFSGLSAIHQAGIIHRDLKPNNLLVDKNGQIHILDFSLSYAADDLKITPHENIVGTPGYLAPEVVAGAEASKSSDLFAAGVIIYELLTNRPLFTAKDIYTTLQMVHQAEAPNLTKIRTDVPPALWQVIKKLLAKHPFDRYGDAQQALADLQKISLSTDSGLRKRLLSRPRLQYPLRNIIRASLIFFTLLSLGMLITFKFVFQGLREPDKGNASADTAAALNPLNAVTASVAAAKILDIKNSASQIKETGKSTSTAQKQLATVPEAGKNPADKGLTGESAVSTISEVKPAPDSSALVKIMASLKPDSVKARFEIYPWAKVYCDGVYLGTTPFLTEKTIKTGNRQLRFEHPDFPPLTKNYSVVSADTFTVDMDLTAEFGRLEFAVIPWAYLFIDDIEKGTLPIAKPFYLPAGQHIIRLKHPQFKEIVRPVSLDAGETLVIEASFSR